MNMTRPMLVPALLLLSACSPATTPPADSAEATTTPMQPTQEPASSSGTRADAASMQAHDPSAVELPAEPAAGERASASISGAIRDGNRAPPALRVCATPVGGGKATCIETSAGAHDYRIDVAPGRYYLLGWVQAGELKLIAHASQIRCIRAPCPPDELIVVTVAAGQHRDSVDLNGGYMDIPAGWPTH